MHTYPTENENETDPLRNKREQHSPINNYRGTQYESIRDKDDV